MPDLQDQVAVVTGASSGIGKAIALQLAARGTQLYLVGRHLDALESVAAVARQTSANVLVDGTDLTADRAIDQLKAKLTATFGGVDILVHSAGIIRRGTVAIAPIADFDQQYAINVRAPYLLTQTLLPLLMAQQGQVVFINSSVIQGVRPGIGQYAATKQALKAIADTLRAEVNPQRVRVLSVYPGRTATPLQRDLHAQDGKDYHPDSLMQPEDVAAAVVSALTLPRTAEVTDIYLRPFSAPL